jgi:hypothetical protein
MFFTWGGIIRQHTVAAVSVTTTTDKYGDSTTTTTEATVEGVLFAPEGATESVDAQSPNVIGRASLYGAFPRLEADDTIRHDATCCDGAIFEHGSWQVVGGSRGWGPGMVVVPIDKAA